MTDGSAALRGLLRPVRTSTRVAVGVQVIGAIAEIVPFIAIAAIARELLAGGADESRLRMIALIVVVALGVRALCAGGAIMITHFSDAALQAILRRRLVAHFGRMPLGWFDRHASGEVKKATDDDIHALHYLVAHSAVETTAGVAVPLVGLGYLVTLDWRLALVAVLPLPLYAIAFAIMMRDGTEMMARMSEGTSRVNTAIVEFVQGIAVVKTFGRAGEAHAAYRDATRDFSGFFAAWVRPMMRLEAVSSMVLAPDVVLVLNLSLGLAFWSAGWVGAIDVLAASMVALVIPASVMTLSRGMQGRAQAREAAMRLVRLLDQPLTVEPIRPSVPVDAGIEISGVSFSYDDGGEALTDVSMRLDPGTVTALVGPSGSGKSTLAGLVLRFHDPDTGSVMIGGVDVRQIAAADLYSRVGFVLQNVQLLATSIADNIALGRPEATRGEVEHVAREAQIHDRIMALPRGYDSVIGDDANLSGGEAQRVSIARAMLHDPEILVLDEATAFADPDVEAAVQAGLTRLVEGRTLLVIAHRLDTIVGADQIAVLDRGRLVECGPHDVLMENHGTYRSMWTSLEGARA